MVYYCFFGFAHVRFGCGKTWLRSIKVVEIEYNEDGTIKTIDGGGE
jgi:hypothetical protein